MSFDHIVPDPREEREEQEAAVVPVLAEVTDGSLAILCLWSP